MNSEIPNEEIFPPPAPPEVAAREVAAREVAAREVAAREVAAREEPFREAPRMPPQVAVPVVVATPKRKTNRFAVVILLLCAVLIAILCAVSRDFRVVFFAASAIWLVLHAIIRIFRL